MKAEQMVEVLLQNGIELNVIEGGTLKIRYDDGVLSQDDIERIRQHKSEIITLLSKKKKPTREKGYCCAACGNKIYHAIEAWETYELPEPSPWTHEHRAVTHWQCGGCGRVFHWIGEISVNLSG